MAPWGVHLGANIIGGYKTVYDIKLKRLFFSGCSDKHVDVISKDFYLKQQTTAIVWKVSE